jgi:hypothetical protein
MSIPKNGHQRANARTHTQRKPEIDKRHSVGRVEIIEPAYEKLR